MTPGEGSHDRPRRRAGPFLHWLVRTKRFWLAVAIVVAYTIFGFLIAPGIVSDQIVGKIATVLGRQATVRDVDVNPYTLSARVEGFDLQDSDGEVFVSFEELFLDFQVSSLFRRAFTFKIVRLVSPHGHVRLMPDEKPNFRDILDKLAARPVPPPSEKPKKPPRILLQRLEVRDMRLAATNLAHPNPEKIAFTPVDLTLEDFTTIPNRDGTLSLAATGQGGGRWEWTGTVTFEPMHSSGTFAITGEKLPEIWNVIRNRVTWEIPSGELHLRLDYAVDIVPDSMTVAITGGTIHLDQFSFRAKGREPELLALDSLRVSGIELRFPQQTVSVQRIGFAGLRATAWLDPARKVNWLALLAPPVLTPSGAARAQGSSSTAGAPGTGVAVSGQPPGSKLPPAWKVAVSEVDIAHASAHFTDSTVTPPFALELAPVDGVLRNLASTPGAKFDLEVSVGIAGKGTLALQGKAGALPLEADVHVHLAALPLTIFQPYLNGKTKLELRNGDVGVEGQLVARTVEGVERPDVKFEGSVTSSSFLSQDARTRERFLAWKKLDLKGVAAGSRKVRIQSIEASEPYGRIIVFENRRTNIDEVFMIPPRDTTRTAVATPPKPPPVPTQIGVVRLANGTADFADLSLILPFAAGIVDLNGEVSGLSSDELERADVKLDGGLNPAGAVHVRGKINPLSGDLYTDLAVQFQDFDMPALSPYSGQFLGRKVDRGKLRLDLKYQVAKRELVGENKIILDQLEFGEDVESPEATSLPVGLAVALLKDRQGKIDLDLPVKGNLDDPKFSIWDAVWDVLRNIVVKLVTAPFSLLGRLVGWGGDSDEMSHVYFAPGLHEIDPAEHEKVTKLAQALAERPQLRLEVRGCSNVETDSRAIREMRFTALADDRSARDPGKYPPTLGGAGYAPRLFRDLYDEQFGRDSREALEQHFQVPKIEKDGKPHPEDKVLDEAAFYAELRRVLTEAHAVDPTELRALAQDRSTAVKSFLVQTGNVVETRIFLLEVDENAKLTDGRIQMDLQLGS